MPAIEQELNALKENLNDMLSMVKKQMEKCMEAIREKDRKVAEEVLTLAQ